MGKFLYQQVGKVSRFYVESPNNSNHEHYVVFRHNLLIASASYFTFADRPFSTMSMTHNRQTD